MGEARKSPRPTVGSAANTPEPSAGGAAKTDQFVISVDSATHKIIGLERLDVGGTRHELTEQDWIQLTGDDAVRELAGAVEEAFQAGVAEGAGEQDDADDLDEDIVLWQLLGAGRRMNRVVPTTLRRTLLRRLLVRRLLLRRFASSTAEAWRNEPIVEQARNGSASSV